MKKIFYLTCFLFVGLGKVEAQYEGIFKHYLVDPTLINPAYAGFSDKYQFFAHYRSDLSGFPGAPQDIDLSINAPVSDKLGLGLRLLSENIASLNNFLAEISYGYHYTQKGFKAGIGFSTSFLKTRLLSSVDQGYNFMNNDIVVQDAMLGTTYFDASVGATALINDQIFVSLSSPNLIRARLGQTAGQKDTSTLFKQFILYTGYIMKKDQYTFEPSIQIRQAYASPFEVDVNAKIGILGDRLVGAITYSPGSSGKLGFMIGTKQSSFSFYYTYTSSLALINNYTSSGNEITLAVELNKPDKKFQRKKKYSN